MEKVKRKDIKVLELNNVDVYGKNFNGYSLVKYANAHPEKGVKVSMVANHRLGSSRIAKRVYKDSSFEMFDYRIEQAERTLGIKNQISIAEGALVNHPLFKEAEILHFHMYHNMQLPIEFLLKIPKEKKIIIELHDTFWLTDDKIPMLEVFRFSDVNKKSLDAQRKRVLENIDAEFVVHSQYMLNLFRKSKITKNLPVRLIDFGINLKKFHQFEDTSYIRRKYRIPEENFVCLCRAQKEFKGLDYIIEALNNLTTDRKVTLIAVSNKGLLGNLTDKVQVIDLGSVSSDEKLAELYNVSDVFLAPSTEESFGFMAVEAMACGKPVIVFDGTALPDTVNAPKIGISTKPSSEELRIAIERMMLYKAEREKRGKMGARFVRQRYDEQKYFEKNLSLYTRLAKKKERNVTLPRMRHATAEELAALELALERVQKNVLDEANIQINEPLIINYNSLEVQTRLVEFNANLYEQVRLGTCLTLKQKIFRLIPISIRNTVKRMIGYEQRKEEK